MTVSRPLFQLFTLVATAVLVGATLFLAGFWAGSAHGQAESAPAASVPAWFGPVWDYYDRNPAVTPAFDLAALYAGEAPVGLASRR